jgi:hypothetical protein
MAYNPYHYETDREVSNLASIEDLRGEIRAVKAILLELPEVTPEVIDAAKRRLRSEQLNHRNDATRLHAEIKVAMDRPIDEHAEAVLDEMRHHAQSKQRNGAVNER